MGGRSHHSLPSLPTSSIPWAGGSGAENSYTGPCGGKKNKSSPGRVCATRPFPPLPPPPNPGPAWGGLGPAARQGGVGGACWSRGADVREETSLRYTEGAGGSSQVAHPGNPNTEMGRGAAGIGDAYRRRSP